MKKLTVKKIATLGGISMLVLLQLFMFAEPVIAVSSANDNVVVTLVVDEGITITDGAASSMSPNLGISANSSIGSSSWTVKTNAAAGYTLAVKASASPALVSGGNSFADYTPAVADTPEVWSVPSGSKEFGYSAFGTDTATATWGTAGTCGSAGIPDVAMKYQNTKITDRTIATRATVTPTAGIATTICFAAEQDTIYAAAGTYTATITGTATTL